MANVVIRVDNSPQIGMGHFTRCTALAIEFAEQGHAVFLVTSKKSILPEFAEKIYTRVWFVDNEWDINSEKPTLEKLVSTVDIDIAVVDTYRAGQDYYSFLSRYSKLVAAFDDTGECEFPVDVLINGNIYAEKLNYTTYSKKTLLLLGPRYLILRPEFKLVKPIQINEEVKKVLITFGGSDVLNATPAILEILLQSYKDLEFLVLIGPGYKNTEQIQHTARENANVKLMFNPGEIANIMREADIAISAAGSTVYELAYLGIPSIIFVVADNQQRVGKTMQERNVFLNAGNFNTFNSEKFLNIFDSLVNGFELRKSMQSKAQNIFNTFGAKRCVEAISEYFKIDN